MHRATCVFTFVGIVATVVMNMVASTKMSVLVEFHVSEHRKSDVYIALSIMVMILHNGACHYRK